MTSEIDLTIDLAKLASTGGDLELGLFNGGADHAGFSSLGFQVLADGHEVANQTFTSTAAANSYFRNDAIDLGNLAALAGDGTLGLVIRLTTTSATASGGYEAQFLVGQGTSSNATPSMHDERGDYLAWHEAHGDVLAHAAGLHG